MILLDKPFVSDFLIDTIKKNHFPVVQTRYSRQLDIDKNLPSYNTQNAIADLKKKPNQLFYTNSENSIEWMVKYLQFTDIPRKIKLFKDKVQFRKLTKKMYPDFYYQEVSVNDIETLNISNFPKPFIIKPSVGFFSIGVYKASDEKDWLHIINLIKKDLLKAKKNYPSEVLDISTFIIEECFEGTEFAFDTYYNKQGEPVILNIFEHLFSSKEDLSDRVYFTSKEVVEKHLDDFTRLLEEIGVLADLRNFPVHVEVRINNQGKIFPIELNPMRFGGWCTTADLSFYAYGFNPYEFYFYQKKPDWQKLLKDKNDKTFSIVVLDNSSGFNSDQIKEFNFKKLLSEFEKPLDLRKIDFHEYPVFGFLFTETCRGNFSELEKILRSDLRDYIILK